MTEFTAADRRWMRRALALARRGWGRTSPNPMVGAVLVRNGVVVGEGCHTAHGAPHAEREALAAARERARGSTLYVTLEPCNHVGRTPPCVPALVEAGVVRVLYAAADPNPESRSGGDALQRAGLAVDSGLEAEASRELNAAFHHRFASARPFVTLKLAMSIDGAIADASRRPGWLTGERARRHVHLLRAAHDAIAVGSGTVLTDDPQLTVRGVRKPRVAPTRVVFDRRGRIGAESRLVKTAARVPTLVVTSDPPPAAVTALSANGVEVVPAATLADGLAALRNRGLGSLLCEGGAAFAGALLADGAVDRLVIFRAPVVLGAGALLAFGAAPAAILSAVPRWRLVEQRRIDDDEMSVYAPGT